MDKFTQSLSGLLPQGHAWPRDPSSTLMSVIAGLAATFAEHHETVRATVAQWQPHSTVTRLEEWEEALGLPDACFGLEQSQALRHQVVLQRLRGVDLPYEDSSPAAPGVIAQLCADVGYPDVTVRYNTPFRVGRNRVGDRLGALDGRLHVMVPSSSTPFRVGDRVGRRLIERVVAGPNLACYLDRVVPARFSINIHYL